MRRHARNQRVDIDEYFHGFEDFSESLATQPSWPPADSSSAPSVKAMLISARDQTAPALAPYQYQSSTLRPSKALSALELEAAHRAVSSIKSQLIGDRDPGVQAQVSPPTPAAAVVEDGSGSPSTSFFPSSLALQQTSSAWREPQFWWGSLVALLGTTVAAVVVYTYNSPNLDLYLKQAQVLKQQSLAQVNHLGRLSLQQAHRALPTQPVISKTNRTADQAALAQAMKLAYTAAELTQSAITPEDWQQVLMFWRRAIDELQPIQAEPPLFEQAQERRRIYQDNFAYAQSELDKAPFRMAVQAAELASEKAANATTSEDWAVVAATWQEALSQMESVSTKSPRYKVAQAKRAEYATKFAYAQNRYLALHVQGEI